jgi:hypothetical protein
LLYKLIQGKGKKYIAPQEPEQDELKNSEIKVEKESTGEKPGLPEKIPKFLKYTEEGYILPEEDEEKGIFRWR